MIQPPDDKPGERLFENKTLGIVARAMVAFGVPLVIWIVSTTHDDIVRQNQTMQNLAIDVRLLNQTVARNRVEYRDIVDRDLALRDAQLKEILRRLEEVERRLVPPPLRKDD